MDKSKNLISKLGIPVWIMFLLIVLEILYMISPFALYYYSLYRIPLNLFQSNSYTAFLTVNILPHFTATNSIIISALIFISWPLIVLGQVLFLISFFQVYWVKFTRKGVVSGGLYRIIRHPQYISLLILGLGTTIYWSRFIVYIAYCTMLFLYYFLARQEERICTDKFGETYLNYKKSTGMFFPKKIENIFIKMFSFFPKKIPINFATILVIYVIYIFIVIIIGFWIRNYTLSRINAVYSDNYAVVSLERLEESKIRNVIDIIRNDEKTGTELTGIKKGLIYIVPSGWSIPELGIIGGNAEVNYLINTTAHGNSSVYDKDLYIVFITEPILFSQNSRGEEILKNCISYIPHLEFSIDLKRKMILNIKDRTDKGKWEGIPIPVY